MDQFASVQAVRLLGKLAFQVRHAVRRPNEEAIHDLRVSIRRFSRCVREFRQFFPRHQAKKILKQLERVMDLAAEMRNRDIAIELIDGEGSPGESVFAAELRQEREAAKRKLSRALLQWRRRDFSRKWRPWLDL
ncbi:MAG TPA: CHAD domain-containing protein [Candidatus Solibacter sp.]|nr:CHAD domain-containing protein [Candidatus Solibacter sp.]